MGVVGSLPSSLTNNNDIQNEQSLPSSSNQNNNNEAMSVIPDVIISNHIKTSRHDKSYERRSRNHVCIKKHQLRISTGLCSKYRRCGNKEKLRYKKNRSTTRILNTTHDNIREQLKKKIENLELKQNNLLSQVENLYLYKQQLEVICQQVRSNPELIE